MKKLKKFVKKLEKYKKNLVSDDKGYLKELVRKERKIKKNISVEDLARKLYFPEKDVKMVLDEIKQEELKKIEKKPKKIKKNPLFFKKIKEKLSKLIDEDDRKELFRLFVEVTFYGILLNFSLFVIFGIKFNYYSFFGWGIAFWFMKREVIDMVRGLWMK